MKNVCACARKPRYETRAQTRAYLKLTKEGVKKNKVLILIFEKKKRIPKNGVGIEIVKNWVQFPHSPILLLNKSVVPMAIYCFCRFLYPRTKCIM